MPYLFHNDLSDSTHEHHENPTDYDIVFQQISSFIDRAAAAGHVLNKEVGCGQRRGAWMLFTARTVAGDRVATLSYCFSQEADFAACAQHYRRLRRVQKLDRLLLE
jgi:hypothetical protein